MPPSCYLQQVNLLVLNILLLIITISQHSTDGTCLDAGGSADCGTWAADGECMHNPSYMYHHCAFSCQSTCLCPQFVPSGKAADKNCFCAYWALSGHCETNPTLQTTTCQTSCDLVTTIDCGPPPDVLNTTTINVRTTWGANATYECAVGYDKTGGMQGLRYCAENATWAQLWYGEGPDPVCTPWSCPTPSAAARATLSVDNALLYYATRATYTCEVGTELTAGDTVLTCSFTRDWAGTLPTCTVLDCGTPQTVDGATYTSTGTAYGDTVTYTCAGGAQMTGDATLTCGTTKSWPTTPQCVGVAVTSPLVIYITVPLLTLLATGVVLLAYYLFIFYMARRSAPKPRSISRGRVESSSSQLSLVGNSYT